MKHYLPKLAAGGMIGRKKDTLLLGSVSVLTFLFITCAVVLLSSIRITEENQRKDLYGTWQVMAAEITEEEADLLEKANQGGTSARSVIVGKADDCGVIGSLEGDWLSLSNLTLEEGRWPSTSQEIVLEQSKMGQLGLSVGDTLDVILSYDIVLTDKGREERENQAGEKNRYVHKSLQFEDCSIWATVQTGYLPGEYDGSQVIVPFNLTVKVTKSFTVCGVIATYSDLWDSSVYEMPNGYITREAADEIYGAVSTLQDHFLEIKETVPEYVVLMSHPGMGVQTLFEELLPTYNELMANDPYHRRFEIVGHTRDGKGNYEGKIHGIASDSGADTMLSYRGDKNGIYLRTGEGYQEISAEEAAHGTFTIPGVSPITYEIKENSEGSLLTDYYGYPLVTVSDNKPDAYQITEIHTWWGGEEYYSELYSYGKNIDNGKKVILQIIKSEEKYDFYGIYYQIIESFTETEILSGDFSITGMEPLPYEDVSADVLYTAHSFPYRANTYTYPQSGNSGNMVMVLIVAILFVTALCAIFQIFLVQIRWRMKRIVLMKTIGASNAQIFGTLFCEMINYLVISLGLGIPLGLLGGWGVIKWLNFVQPSESIQMFFDGRSIAFGALAGSLSLVGGMMVPLIRSVNIPLTGRSAMMKRPSVRKEKPLKRQNFFRITMRNISVNKGKHGAILALAIFMTLTSIACVYLTFESFEGYRNKIQGQNKPDYSINVRYGMNKRAMEEKGQELKEVGLQSRMDCYVKAENTFLSYDGMLTDSPVISAIYNNQTGESRSLFFEEYLGRRDVRGEQTEIPQDQVYLKTDMYGIKTDTEMMDLWKRVITEGTIDEEAFSQGKEVILLLPMYRRTGNGSSLSAEGLREMNREEQMGRMLDSLGFKVSFSPVDAVYYDQDTSVQVGDTLQLASQIYGVNDQSIFQYVNTLSVKVSAIVRYFPEEPLWPFSGQGRSHVIIGSSTLMRKIYPDSGLNLDYDQTNALKLTNDLFYHDSRGRSVFYIYGTDEINRDNTDIPLIHFAQENSYDVTLWRDSNQALYYEALINALLIALLGIVTALISLLIFGNTLSSLVEQDRGRMGILQSLGISTGSFIRMQMAKGATFGILATVISNGFLALFLMVLTWRQEGCKTIREMWYFLWNKELTGYPWQIHGVICLLFVIISIWLFVNPMRKAMKNSVIENVKAR